ncbi:hypothetical protein NC653_036062 [Populus alba x Populus x berolinensis]|uniref:Legume lectin domain-containing protein n=1 Tax=Populus alba x Populus x berolinensis TaxID=444605 RepID=A0AAD6LIX3_9ROSI|nr:hypothetical protein NC653_036062 [Populus alba x Populus x berolinensis]
MDEMHKIAKTYVRYVGFQSCSFLFLFKAAPVTRTKPTLPLLSTSLDLSSVMLDSMYVGFSSSTGAVASSHYILGWSFNRGGQAQSLDVSQVTSRWGLRFWSSKK